MLLNRFEFLLMNNPVRAAFQKHVDARRFLRLGGSVQGAKALEIGCGRGVGVEVILDVFGAASVDAFDLDPRMIAIADARLRSRRPRVRLWIGDATAITAPDAAYDAVFDFGIIHHVPNWRCVLAEVHRVLRPGGRFYAEEPLGASFYNPLTRRLFAYPAHGLSDPEAFRAALRASGLIPSREDHLLHAIYWFVAAKAAAA
jgi:ubiquinone/menaquinone biosynthesis C-methylase UbiE